MCRSFVRAVGTRHKKAIHLCRVPKGTPIIWWHHYQPMNWLATPLWYLRHHLISLSLGPMERREWGHYLRCLFMFFPDEEVISQKWWVCGVTVGELAHQSSPCTDIKARSAHLFGWCFSCFFKDILGRRFAPQNHSKIYFKIIQRHLPYYTDYSD